MGSINRICFVDKNIVLSDRNIDSLKALKISLADFDLCNDHLNFSEVESLLLHSSLPNEKLRAMINCRFIGIRAHNTDYVDRKVCNSCNIKVVGLNKQHGIDAIDLLVVNLYPFRETVANIDCSFADYKRPSCNRNIALKIIVAVHTPSCSKRAPLYALIYRVNRVLLLAFCRTTTAGSFFKLFFN